MSSYDGEAIDAQMIQEIDALENQYPSYLWNVEFETAEAVGMGLKWKTLHNTEADSYRGAITRLEEDIRDWYQANYD